MPTVNDIYHLLKRKSIEQQILFNEIYIGMAANMLYQLFSAKRINQLFDKLTSGDCHKPEFQKPPYNTGNAVSGVGRPDTAVPRQIVIDENPHHCEDCGLIIKPGEKYILEIHLYDDNGDILPRPYFAAKHIICPEN